VSAGVFTSSSKCHQKEVRKTKEARGKGRGKTDPRGRFEKKSGVEAKNGEKKQKLGRWRWNGGSYP